MNKSGQNETLVFIVEDHHMVRRMLGRLIQHTAGFSLCGEADSAEAALVQIPDCQPQLVLVDISLPDMNGIELIRILSERYPLMLTMAISGHDESVYAIAALEAGARGYVMKEKPERVVEGIHHVRDGNIYVSDKVQELLARRAHLAHQGAKD
jgi:DNA-binding NarL/FixJ family response regulator